MLSRNNVFYVVSQFTVILPEQTVFASAGCPSAYQLESGSLHSYWLLEFRCRRALALRIEIKSAALINASYSTRSSSVNRPSFARSPSLSIRSWTGGSTRNSITRRADSASSQRLKGARIPSSTVRALIPAHYHAPYGKA